jgi:hypothetical protein
MIMSTIHARQRETTIFSSNFKAMLRQYSKQRLSDILTFFYLYPVTF